MSERVSVLDVGIEAKTAGSSGVYTYKVTQAPRIGAAHVVALGPRRVLGYVVGSRDVTEEELGFPLEKLKDLGPPVPTLDLPAQTVELANHVSKQTLCSLPVALSLVMPPGVKDRLVEAWTKVKDATPDDELSAAQKESLRVIEESGEMVDTKAKPLLRGVKSSLRALERRGLVARSVMLKPSQRKAQVRRLKLIEDDTRIERFLSGKGKRRPAQSLTVMRLHGSGGVSFTAQEIRALSGVTDSTIRSLVDEGLLVEVVDEGPRAVASPPKPNEVQTKAIKAISSSIESRNGDEFLLFGVTGSGKTEVYLRSAEVALAQGRQVLYLVPEIALTAQVIAQLRERFGSTVAVLHSNMTSLERLENWVQVRDGKAPVVLGARSAVFAPLENIGLIIIDEEHEQSYKQENSPRYHTRELARWLAKKHGAPVVLGSATPSIESFYEAREGRLQLLELPHRAASALLPDIHIEDLTEAYAERKPTLFSTALYDLMKTALEQKHQTILFLNRRAFSPFLTCRECGHRFTCPRCAVSLAYHKRDKRLRCHHCDHSEPAVDICPECQGDKVRPFGVGAEKVEEAAKEEFPEARIARLDRDVARKKGVLEKTFADFRSQDLDILVGTQMIAKGLDFPNVTLVGVIAADISLAIPDFRASERTFQLLSQVSGRAGRGDKPGQVVIQTLNPENPAIVAAKNHDYLGFYEEIIKEREAANYPPFCRLANVLIEGLEEEEVDRIAQEVSKAVREALPDSEVLGPAPCPIERRGGLWRRHVIVKVDPNATFEALFNLSEQFDDKQTRVKVDVDPYSLL